MVVQHNLTAMNANRYLGINNNKLSKSLEKLSSGYAINRAGDNAAGLAVSEKMRSQIAGMTQGVKNAQDGISMVQTFEGALTETHSILQRMKTLADQMANGSYDDPVDRAASQREFLQLNDELNQIADTDFNGVIVLNGGRMADGLKQVDGKFDYANKKEQLMAQAKDMLRADINAANKSIQDAQQAMNTENFDLTKLGDSPEWNTVDENKYDKAAADELWVDLGITKKDAGGNDVADTSVVTEVEVTFTFNGTSWDTTKAVGNDGNSYDTDALVATVVDAANANATGLGGFTLKSKSTNEFADGDVNAIFDATTAKAGDTVTLKFTNGANTQLAPKNAGWADDTIKVDSKSTTEAGAIVAPTVTLNILEDTKMTAELADKFNALNGQGVKIEYKDQGNANNPTITLGDEAAKIYTTTGNNVTINGQSYYVAADKDTAAEKLEIYDKNGGTKLMEIGFTKPVSNGGNTGEGTVGTLSGTLALDTALYTDSSAAVDVSAGENKELGTSAKYQKQITESREQLAKLADIDVTDYESAKAYLTSKGVSTSDAFDKSEAKLTYKDNITLQVGARTKDAVNFTFTYDSEVIGELKGDLDCTASGLGTDKLTIATQEEANYAIDKIDQAINKVSLIRGNFGAIQNRLEHKIDNMNVSIENLTSAESQIRDTNMPQEMMNFTKQQILAQASQSMLAQANQLPQSVLSLLQ